MLKARIDRSCPNEAGFALIEVVISALIAATMVGAAITLLGSTAHAGAEQRRHSEAFAIAQQDQARLRATQLAELNNVLETRTVTFGGTTYTVTSTAKFISSTTSASTCSGENAKADYVQIGSRVTWPSQPASAAPVLIESIVSPVSGSLNPTAGGLAVHAVNNENTPISGVGLTGTGPATFSGTTDSNGCAVFGGLPEGTYAVTPALSSEYVNKDGEVPAAQSIKITSGSTYPLELVYGRAGKAELAFTVRNSAGAVVSTSGDAIIAAATGLTSGARAFGTPGTTKTKLVAEKLFPFTSGYTFYAGSCSTNAPESGAVALSVPAGGTASGTIQLPALYLTVTNSAGTTSEKNGITGAVVTLTDKTCSISGTAVKRTYSTTSGTVANLGVPWGTYEICASYKPSGSSSTRRAYAKVSSSKQIVIHSLTGTSVAINLGSEYESGSC